MMIWLHSIGIDCFMGCQSIWKSVQIVLDYITCKEMRFDWYAKFEFELIKDWKFKDFIGQEWNVFVGKLKTFKKNLIPLACLNIFTTTPMQQWQRSQYCRTRTMTLKRDINIDHQWTLNSNAQWNELIRPSYNRQQNSSIKRKKEGEGEIGKIYSNK